VTAKKLIEIPQGLEDVALVDASACAAAAGCGMSRWHDLVRRGEAPQPAIRAPRFTRWRLAEVRSWLSSVGGDDPAVADRASRASKAAQAQRQMRQLGGN
jgi:predicted DNA-binding transcriptional regulator AlpA